MKEKQIIMSDKAWLNDNIMDTAQILICKALGNQDLYQSVLNTQKRRVAKYQPVDSKHIQLLHDGKRHWLMTYCADGKIFIRDSMGGTLNRKTHKSVSALYKYCTDKHGKLDLTYLPVQRKQDGHTWWAFCCRICGRGVVAGKSPVEASFIVKEMRSHLTGCLEIQELTPFPKTNMDL